MGPGKVRANIGITAGFTGLEGLECTEANNEHDKGAPHGIANTHRDQLNADLLSFLNVEKK